jgi:hypothetical protein
VAGSARSRRIKAGAPLARDGTVGQFSNNAERIFSASRGSYYYDDGVPARMNSIFLDKTSLYEVLSIRVKHVFNYAGLMAHAVRISSISRGARSIGAMAVKEAVRYRLLSNEFEIMNADRL